MNEAVLDVRFPRGTLPTRGFRCPECGNEVVRAEDAKALEAKAREAGFLGLDQGKPRKLLRVGNSLAVTLDPALAREVLRTTKPGTEVRMGRLGKRIVIEPAEAPAEA